MEPPISNTDQVRNLIVDPKKINNNLLCMLCKKLAINPKECEQCQNLYCSTCIENYLKNNQNCPDNCQNFKAKLPHRLVRDAIQQIIVKCKNMNCNQQMTIQNLDNHIQNCDHRIQTCINQGCQKQMPQIEMKDHINNCQFRMIICERCNTLYCFQMKHDCITSLNNKIQQLEQNFQQWQVNYQKIIAELLERIAQCEKQKPKDQKPKCSSGHELKWIFPQIQICESCKQSNTAVRYICIDCNKNYCQKCKKPEFKEGLCPINHPLQYNQQAIQITHCDYCNLNIYQRGESVYSDRYCDLDICNSCYKSLKNK